MVALHEAIISTMIIEDHIVITMGPCFSNVAKKGTVETDFIILKGHSRLASRILCILNSNLNSCLNVPSNCRRFGCHTATFLRAHAKVLYLMCSEEGCRVVTETAAV